MSKLTIKDVQERVKQIAADAGDYEAAHGNEDALWRDVLVAIAEGADHAPSLARAALQTRKIRFARLCA